ncbi:MAG: autotransporter-associated beta strand repeat-containing protein, partial [Pirellulales bacterium]|nr:autotransporter-associated beta strand repeat-containing protein [Pirellulales bacterium]
AGTGQFKKTGAGIMTLFDTNWTNTGTTTIEEGTLKFGNGPAGVGNSSQISIASGATFDMNNIGDTIGSLSGAGSVINGANLTLNGNNGSTANFTGTYAGSGVLTKNGAGSQSLGGPNSFSSVTFSDGRINVNHSNALGGGAIIVGTNADVLATSSGNTVLANNITLNAAALEVFANTGTTLKQTGTISGPGGLVRNDSGAGVVTLAGGNTFAGGVKVTSRGLVLGNMGALGTGTLTVGDAVSPPANPIVIAAETSLSGASAVGNAVVSNQSFSVAGNNDLELSGPISGSGGMTKIDGGVLTLSGANSSYSGATTVNGGTLLVNSSVGSGNVVVNANATLGGTGSIAGQVTVNSGGVLSPGASIESLDVGPLTFNAGSSFTYEVDSTATLTLGADLMKVNGNLTFDTTGTGVSLNIADLAGVSTLLPQGTKFTLFSYAGAISGTFAGYSDGSTLIAGANAYVINYDDTTGGSNFGGGSYANFVTITAVPEVSAFLAVGLVGLSSLGIGWLRKKRASADVA